MSYFRWTSPPLPLSSPPVTIGRDHPSLSKWGARVVIGLSLVCVSAQVSYGQSAKKIRQTAERISVRIEGERSSGSGVVVGKEGKRYAVLTAAHVVKNAESYRLTTSKGHSVTIPFEQIQKIEGLDLALIQFESSKKLTVGQLGNSTQSQIGQPCYLFGVSGTLGRFYEGDITANLTQSLQGGLNLSCSTFSESGMSGGPILNTEKEIIGIITKVGKIRTIGVSSNTFNQGIAKINTIFSFPELSAEQLTSPTTVDKHYLLGIHHAKLGNYQEAIAEFDQTIRLNPEDTKAYSSRGYVYTLLKNYERAVADYDQAIRLQPDYANAYNNRGNAHVALKNYDQAIADYDQAIQYDPNFAWAYNNRGFEYYSRKDFTRAIADYDQAIRLKPDYARAYINRGKAYEAIRDYARAKADFEKADQLNQTTATQ